MVLNNFHVLGRSVEEKGLGRLPNRLVEVAIDRDRSARILDMEGRRLGFRDGHFPDNLRTLAVDRGAGVIDGPIVDPEVRTTGLPFAEKHVLQHKRMAQPLLGVVREDPAA